MRQARIDSFMEAVTNTAIGFIISLVTWQLVAAAFGIPMPFGENMKITAIFTVVSIARQYILRRAFDGKSVWQAIKDRFASSDRPCLYCGARPVDGICPVLSPAVPKPPCGAT